VLHQFLVQILELNRVLVQKFFGVLLLQLFNDGLVVLAYGLCPGFFCPV
jgi:hypothetical protein